MKRADDGGRMEVGLICWQNYSAIFVLMFVEDNFLNP